MLDPQTTAEATKASHGLGTIGCISPGYYRHYKGNLYMVHSLARDTRTEQDVVVYSPCYLSDIRYFTRPVTEWFDPVKNREGQTVLRFTAVAD
jgi:hypothetical protein